MEDEVKQGHQGHVEAFRALYRGAVSFREDALLTDELTAEVAPLFEALRSVGLPQAAEPLDAPVYRESFAMALLLGRRAGELGATPTGFSAMTRALHRAFGEGEGALSLALKEALEVVCLEGYVAGREENLGRQAERRAEGHVPIVTLAPRCVALFLSGDHSPESLERVVDQFGRILFDVDARSAIVDLSGLTDPTPARAAQVFAADVPSRMLGASCVFVGVTSPWKQAAEQGRVQLELIRTANSFADAFSYALRLSGSASPADGPFMAWIRGWFRPRGGGPGRP